MPNPKRYKPTVTRVVVNGMEMHLRDVLHVQHLNIKPTPSGILEISTTYMVGVETAYQIWANGEPDKGTYIGVVFKLKDAKEWCAVDSSAHFWSSYAETRRGAIEYLWDRFFGGVPF